MGILGAPVSHETRRLPVARYLVPWVLATAGLLASDDDRGVPRTPAPANFVTLRVAPNATDRAFEAGLGVAMRELTPRSQAQADALDRYLPPGFVWKSYGGTFRPSDRSAPALPCRAFALGLPAAATASIGIRVGAAVPVTYRALALQDALEFMAVAVASSRPDALGSFFPVPLGGADGDAARTLSIRALRVASSAALLELDGAIPALLREMVATRLVAPQEARRALLAQSPFDAQSADANSMPLAWVEGSPPYEGLAATISSWFSAQSPRAEVLSLSLFAGRIPGATLAARTVNLAGLVGLLEPGDATPPPLAVGFRGSADAGGAIGFEGFAWPAVTGTGVEVTLSAMPLPSFARTRAALIHQLLRGWRWHQILKSPAAASTQTLLRFNEPLWEYIAGTTARDRIAAPAIEPLDAIELQVLDARSRDARLAAARAEESAQAFARDGVRGRSGDGFYPAGDLLDHRMCRQLVGALEGAGGAGPLLAGARNQAAALERAKTRFAREISRLVSDGFTRPTTTAQLAAAARSILRAVGAPGADGFPSAPGSGVVEAPALEPDLVWLERALRAIPPSAAGPDAGPLAHMFSELAGTRLQAAMSDLVSTQSVQAMQWSSRPALAEGTLVYFFFEPGAGLPGSGRDPLIEAVSRPPASSLPPSRYSTPIAFAYAVEKSKRATGLPDEAWFESYRLSRPESEPTTAGDVATFFNLYRKDRLKAAAAALAAERARLSRHACEVVALRFDPRGRSFGLVSAPGHAPSELESRLLAAIAESAGMAAKLAELAGQPAARGSEEHLASRIEPLLIDGGEALPQTWERFLVGPDLMNPARGGSYAELRARLQALARLAGVTLTLTTADGNKTKLE